MKEIDYKNQCYDLIARQLVFNVRESKCNIEVIFQFIKILEEHEKQLISRKPLFFKHNWKMKIGELEKNRMEQYELISKEISFIESNFIN